VVAERLVRENVDLVIHMEALGKGPEYVFRDARIEVEVSDVTKLADVTSRLRLGIRRSAPLASDAYAFARLRDRLNVTVTVVVLCVLAYGLIAGR
jgi:hypothetical protein